MKPMLGKGWKLHAKDQMYVKFWRDFDFPYKNSALFWGWYFIMTPFHNMSLSLPFFCSCFIEFDDVSLTASPCSRSGCPGVGL